MILADEQFSPTNLPIVSEIQQKEAIFSSFML